MASTATEIYERWQEYGAAVATSNHDIVDGIAEQAVAHRFAEPSFVAFAHSEQLPEIVSPIVSSAQRQASSSLIGANIDWELIERTALQLLMTSETPQGLAPRRNGCHNRKPFAASQLVQDGWLDLPVDGFGNRSRVPRWKEIPFRMRQECSYANETDLGRADPGCAGCTWRNA